MSRKKESQKEADVQQFIDELSAMRPNKTAVINKSAEPTIAEPIGNDEAYEVLEEENKETPAPAPAPFSLSFKNVSALEFNFFKPDAEQLGVQHILRFAGLLGTEKQKHHIGANLIFEVRKLDEDQQPAYLFEICEVTQAGVIRTARHFAINQYWSLAQFFTQEISDNADTIAANLYAVSLIEIRAGAAKGGKDLPIFRVEKAEGFTFTL
jgi:hypothetical protein